MKVSVSAAALTLFSGDGGGDGDGEAALVLGGATLEGAMLRAATVGG